MVVVAPRSAKLVEARGARFTLLFGYVFVLLGFLTMLLLWKENIAYWKVGLGYAFVGIGVGLAGTPASHSLTGSVPVKRVGMASGTADLQRDLGGAIMQSIFGALLTAGYAAAAGAAVASSGKSINSQVQADLTKSFAQRRRHRRPVPGLGSGQHRRGREDLLPPGRPVGIHGGIVAVLLGAALVFVAFPEPSASGRYSPSIKERTPPRRPRSRRLLNRRRRLLEVTRRAARGGAEGSTTRCSASMGTGRASPFR